MARRILNDALRAIVNAEKRGKSVVNLNPISTVTSFFLNIMKNHALLLAARYIKDFQVYDSHRAGRITVDLHGGIKDCRQVNLRKGGTNRLIFNRFEVCSICERSTMFALEVCTIGTVNSL